MKKVAILGATGMLGSGVYSVLKDKYYLVLSVREKQKVQLLDKAYGGTREHKLVEFNVEQILQDFKDRRGSPGEYFSAKVKEFGKIDYVINCIGLVIASSNANPELALFINSALPHILARQFQERLIHITTDCAFNGKENYPYNERSIRTPVDIYGLSKSMGEPTQSLTLRTSIIGRELESFSGLLEWFLLNKGKQIKGFSKHYWNGITTREFGRICDKIITSPKRFPSAGLFHVFSTKLSKYQMLMKFKRKYKINVNIEEESSQFLDRSLSTIYDLKANLGIKSFDAMLDDL